MWSDMASPNESRSGDITLAAKFFRSAGVETFVQEGKMNAQIAKSLRTKDMVMNL